MKTGKNNLIINGKEYRMLNEKDPARLPWGKLGIDMVFECTGVFRNEEGMEKHLEAGAKRVILSAPEKTGEVEMVVHGVNKPEGTPQLISCASCTTNCISPIVEIIGRRIGIKKATMTTIHAYTSSQAIIDGPRNKWRRGRAAAINFVPIVSSDIIKDPRASIVDLNVTQVVDGDLLKVMSWYDSEWGYASQMVREIKDKGCQAEFFHLDTSDEREVKEVLAQVNNKFGGIQILVNNA